MDIARVNVLISHWSKFLTQFPERDQDLQAIPVHPLKTNNFRIPAEAILHPVFLRRSQYNVRLLATAVSGR